MVLYMQINLAIIITTVGIFYINFFSQHSNSLEKHHNLRLPSILPWCLVLTFDLLSPWQPPWPWWRGIGNLHRDPSVDPGSPKPDDPLHTPPPVFALLVPHPTQWTWSANRCSDITHQPWRWPTAQLHIWTARYTLTSLRTHQPLQRMTTLRVRLHKIPWHHSSALAMKNCTTTHLDCKIHLDITHDPSTLAKNDYT